MSMNAKQVRVIDPVLSTVARGYSDPQFVGDYLFPVVPVHASGGQIIEFDKSSWKKVNARRAPGGDIAVVEYGYAGKPFSLKQDSLRGKVPREHLRDGAVVPGINHATIAVNTTMSMIKRGQETEQATLATDASKYAATNKIDLTASSWNDPDRNPVTDIKNGKLAIEDSCGFSPNTLVLSGAAWAAISNNPHTLGLFTRGEVENLIITPAMLSAKLDVAQVVIGRLKDASGAVWGTHAVLAYTAVGSPSNALPSYGYTYQMDGNPVVEEVWFDKSCNSFMYPVNNEYEPVIAGADAGYLFIGAGAPH